MPDPDNMTAPPTGGEPIFGAAPGTSDAAAPGWSGFAVSQHATIMMVDDDEVIVAAVQAFLESVGYSQFASTTHPAEAPAMVERVRPDLLLLDLRMPEIDGFEVMRRVRSTETGRYLPIIILTGDTDHSTRLRALESGATDFLTKPVDPSELQLRVRNTLAFKAYQDKLADMDPVTGLRNRRRFELDLCRNLTELTAPANQCALLHIDLSRFKQINDTFGYRVGDKLLALVARRLELVSGDVELGLTSTMGETSARVNISHVAGNGFAMLLTGLRDPEHAQRVVRAVLKGFTLPFSVDDKHPPLRLSACVGVAMYPVDAADAATLLKHAEIAMYQAKKRGPDSHAFFSADFNARAMERVALETDLRQAIERRELELYYQPKIEVSSGFLTGAEALLRWRHPERGMVSPAQFIPLAEETGMIGDIGRWVLFEAGRQIRRWHDAGLPPVSVSVNVSAAQFKRSAILRDVKQVVALMRTDPSMLVLELTESQLMEDLDGTLALLNALRGLGVRLSIDDFGTGYSSLAYLRRLPIDELKIDRSFVMQLPGGKDSLAIVGAVIAMGRALNLKVVAEGVETEGQLAELRRLRCNIYQGFLYSKPVPVAEFEALLVRDGRMASNDRRQDMQALY